MSAQDVTAILDSGLNPVFASARPIKATVQPVSKAMEHPLETGAVITDHRVLLPVVIELSLVLSSADYPAVYQSIRDAYKSGSLFTIQTRVDSFPSMLIEKMPHEETADMADGVALALTFKEARFVDAQFTAAKVSRPKDAKTVKKGQQQPSAKTVPERKSSILAGLFK